MPAGSPEIFFTFEKTSVLFAKPSKMHGPGSYFPCLVSMAAMKDFPFDIELNFSTDHHGRGGIWLFVRNRHSGFAKTVTLDFSWSEFVRMVGYKAERAGKHLVLVDRFYPSSKTCSACGFIKNDLKLSDRSWSCPCCHATHDRDVNAANNLKREGKRILLEGMNIKITTNTTAGSHASGDRVRPVATRAVVDEGRIHAL